MTSNRCETTIFFFLLFNILPYINGYLCLVNLSLDHRFASSCFKGIFNYTKDMVIQDWIAISCPPSCVARSSNVCAIRVIYVICNCPAKCAPSSLLLFEQRLSLCTLRSHLKYIFFSVRSKALFVWSMNPLFHMILRFNSEESSFARTWIPCFHIDFQ